MPPGKWIHVILVLGFWSLVIWYFISASARRRRDAEKDAIERKAMEERILKPDWKFYEQHLQRPAPAALRELYADKALVTGSCLKFGKGDRLSTFSPLDADALLDTRDLLGFDIMPFATGDCGDPIYLCPGPAEPDTVYITYHDDNNKTKIFAESAAALLEKLKQANRTT